MSFNIANTYVPDKLQAMSNEKRYMLYDLMDAQSDDIVFVETNDDVSILHEDGSYVLQQIKTSTSSNNPTSNRSVDFWKTLHNWVETIKNNPKKYAKTSFEYIVLTDKQLVMGDITKSFVDANDKDEAITVLNKAKSTLWGEKEELKKSIPPTYSSFLDCVFDVSNLQFILKIITNFSITIFENNFFEKLYEKFCKVSLLKEYQKQAYVDILGFIEEVCDNCSKSKTDYAISKMQFNEKLSLLNRKYNQNSILCPLSSDYSDSEREIEVKKRNMYIKQLELIESDFGIKLEAANSYMRTVFDIAEWSKEAIIFPENIDNYLKDLSQFYSHEKTRIGIINKTCTEVEKGQLLYSSCCQQKTQLNSMLTPHYLGIGCYNQLSNELKLGWHTNYLTMLGDEKNEENN